MADQTFGDSVNDIPVALTQNSQLKDSDLRVYIWLLKIGVSENTWTDVRQKEVAQALSSEGRPISSRSIIRCLERLTLAGYLSRSGRMYRANRPNEGQ